MEKIFEKTNLLWAAAVTLLTSAFGIYWYIFAAFISLNVIDYASGIVKARYTRCENSSRGLQGIIKKVGYWVVIAIAFFISYIFHDLGLIIGIDLGFGVFIGWFVLATFIINEIRSILENLVEIGVEVPPFLIKGLEVAKSKLENAETDGEEEEK